MGGEGNRHPIPDIAPFGVVAQRLCRQCHPNHEAEGLREISEAEGALQFALHQRPGGQGFGESFELRGGQGNGGHGGGNAAASAGE